MKSMMLQLRATAFVNGAPKSVRIAELLGKPLIPVGDVGDMEALKLPGPRLMWGQARYAFAKRAHPLTAGLWKLAKACLPLVWGFALCWLLGMAFFGGAVLAQGVPNLPVEMAETPEDVTSTIELLLMLTILTLSPSILILTTAFTRIIIVFGFLRMAIGTQQLPPTQIITGLALFLTFMIMRPTFNDIKDNALVPYLDAEITQSEAWDHSVGALREFMFGQVARTDMLLFKNISGQADAEWTTYGDIDTLVLIPAFATSELKRGFYMGFMLYLPFLVIDLIVSTVLISMGMLVLPPILISLPFKLLLFVLVDGWTLVIRSIVASFLPSQVDPGG